MIGKKITQTHKDIDSIIEPIINTPKKTMKDFKGCLSDEAAKSLHEAVADSKTEWEERLKKQF